MVRTRDFVVAVLVTFCLAAMLFSVRSITSQSVPPYNPWYDLNDDGVVNMKDIALVARAFGSSGTPLNMTDFTPGMNSEGNFPLQYVYPRNLNLNLTELYILEEQQQVENESGIWGGWDTYGYSVTYTLSLNKVFFDAYAPYIRPNPLLLSFNGTYALGPDQSITLKGQGCFTFWIIMGFNSTINWLNTSAFGDVEIASLSTTKK